MPDAPVRDPALEYFYFGFYRALRRFRATTVAGWCVAGAGIGGFALRWDPVWSGDLTGAVLCALLVVAGILLVQQSVTELSSYAQIPFPRPPGSPGGGEKSCVIEELAALLEEVREGGWQDAARALTVLRTVGERHGLPAPDGAPLRPGAERADSPPQ